MTIFATLCYIRKNGKVLLQKKAKGLFGGGKFNAPGGRLKPGEIPENGAIRESLEETGLKVANLRPHGKLIFYFGEKEKPDWIVYVFSTNSFGGELKEGVEGMLEWIDEDKIPFENMWDDDRHWVPLLLENKVFEGIFYFDKEAKSLLNHTIKLL